MTCAESVDALQLAMRIAVGRFIVRTAMLRIEDAQFHHHASKHFYHR